jgi:pantoate--beta-alanine ligase
MIIIIESAQELISLINFNKKKGRSIGFVPTMGGIHKGHVSLARKCKKENDLSIASIFVNPTQFNNSADLAKYPRDIEKDLLALFPSKIDIVFAPPMSEVYPNGINEDIKIDLGGLDKTMEGAFRPGHFAGVAQVVKRLLDIVKPDTLYMGQKDFQQFTIIQHMINSLEIDTKLVVCPIIREDGGLAMSTRNERLSPETRQKAKIIHQYLKYVKKNIDHKSIDQIIDFGHKKLNKPPFKLEYISIVDGHSLLPINSIDDAKYAVACVAVWADEVRLIDNLILKS